MSDQHWTSAVRMIATVVLAASGGYAANWLKMPLPWVLGSMLGTAIAMLLGIGERQPLPLRRCAQIVVGTALGLTFTREVLLHVLSVGHLILLGALFSVGLTAVFSRVLQVLARVDGATAVYASAVGASTEMALQAHQSGANGAQVASAHAIRIAMVVSVASVVAHYSGDQAVSTLGISQGLPLLHWQLSLLFLALSPLAGWLGSLVRIPNPWLLGPVILAAAFAALGTHQRMYPWVLVGAQVVIGWSLGQHMTREFFMKSPRLLLSAATVTLCMLLICVSLSWGLSVAGHISMLTGFLALAPGGTAEMALLAKTYGIGAPVVTAFHFFRVIVTILSIGWLVRFLVRVGWVKDEAPAASP